MQRRSTTAAAATPDIAVVRFAAVDLLGDVLGKTCRLHTGPIAIERRIVTRAGINVVADMSAIGFDHVAAQPHDHGKTTHELTPHARENLLMASMRAFKWMVHADRTSVVSGKSVSVRGDLGGGRIIKKKKEK